MSAPGLDERDHRDAIVALLTPVLGVNIYDFGRVPGGIGPDGQTNAGTLPDNYTLLSIERAFVPVSRLCAGPSRSSWRLTLRYVSRYVDNARNTQQRITGAVESARLVVDGYTSTPVQHETTDAIEPDDGRFSGALTYTYSL